jgi:Domain of unknown function (DUF4410)
MSRLHLTTIFFCLISPLCLTGSALRAQEKPTGIEVEMVQSEEIKLPSEFQVALYENLVQQLQKKGKFEHVYRDGDRNAAEHPDTIVLHSTVMGFKQGSERVRQVTTVAGATSIRVHCRFSDTEGHTLLERDIKGKVRFFGGNLKATSDFAKKAASAARGVTIPAKSKSS